MKVTQQQSSHNIESGFISFDENLIFKTINRQGIMKMILGVKLTKPEEKLKQIQQKYIRSSV